MGDGDDVYGTVEESETDVRAGAEGQPVIDTRESEQKFAKQAGITIQNITAGGGAGKWLVILILLLVGVVILWWMGSKVLGFFYTQLGMFCIILLLISFGFYLFLRQAGYSFKGLMGGVAEVALIFLMLLVFVGISDELQQMVFSAMPIIFLGAIGYLGYKGVSMIKDDNLRKFAVIAIVVAVIAIPAFEATISTQTFGRPLEMKLQLSRSAENSYRIVGVLQQPMATFTMTTDFNPYFAAGFEMSHLMWVEAGSTTKVYVDIMVTKHTGEGGILYQEMARPVYISLDTMTSIWGMIRLPVEPRYAEYQLYAKAYNTEGITLADVSFIYSEGG